MIPDNYPCFYKDHVLRYHFGGKKHEIAIEKCENIAKNPVLLILFYRKCITL
jgi:hypothetical protein